MRGKPLSWPGRVADGVAKSLVSLAPASVDDPVNVKCALLHDFATANRARQKAALDDEELLLDSPGGSPDGPETGAEEAAADMLLDEEFERLVSTPSRS